MTSYMPVLFSAVPVHSDCYFSY